MNYPVDGHRAKVERAKKHLVDLKTEVARFLDENPYNAFEEDDPQRRQRVVRARVKPLSTIGLSLLAGDTVHNARSAFDHLARRLVLSNGGRATGDTKFPVFTDKAGFESQGLKKNIKGAHQGAIALVTLLQPYETRKRGEPDHLYVLNRLDNFDKHRALNVVGCGLAAVRWDMRPTTGKDLLLEGVDLSGIPPAIAPMEDGAELFRLPAPHTILGVNVNYQVTVTVAFEEEGPAHGRPLTQTLEELIDFTEQTIGLFDRFL